MSEISEWVTGKVGVRIEGIPLEFEITVPAAPVKPHRMLPIFHQMANSFVEVGVDVVKSEGKTVSCKARCGACCRQAVPISEAEIYQIAELVNNLPEPQQTRVRRRFNEAAAHFHRIGWYERFLEHQRRAPEKEPDEAIREGIAIVLEYFHQQIPCPFLEDESCSIHPNRPVACREYLVTTPAVNCADPTPNSIRIVDLLIKPSRALRRLGSRGKLSAEGFPILTRALELAENYPEDFEEKSGPEWMKEFFEILTDKAIPKVYGPEGEPRRADFSSKDTSG
ncbi:MAG: YkgJ family cysteine cluster protein [Blastocatellia bacterium]